MDGSSQATATGPSIMVRTPVGLASNCWSLEARSPSWALPSSASMGVGPGTVSNADPGASEAAGCCCWLCFLLRSMADSAAEVLSTGEGGAGCMRTTKSAELSLSDGLFARDSACVIRGSSSTSTSSRDSVAVEDDEEEEEEEEEREEVEE